MSGNTIGKGVDFFCWVSQVRRERIQEEIAQAASSEEAEQIRQKYATADALASESPMRDDAGGTPTGRGYNLAELRKKKKG